jgi:mRNA interferase MazF
MTTSSPARLPEAGDVVWVELDSTAGSEQAGRRPALVVTSRAYHESSRRAMLCPITSRHRDWPFNVALPSTMRTIGSILVDQVRMIDRESRIFGLIEVAPPPVLQEVRERLRGLIGDLPKG